MLKMNEANTLLDVGRLTALREQLTACAAVPGDVMELGVYRGGSLRVLAETLSGLQSEKKLYGLDTFTGIPYHQPGADVHKVGDFSETSYEAVLEFMKPYPCELKRGMFPTDFQPAIYLSVDRLSFAHFDGDQYESARSFFDYCQIKMSPGGILAIDDYNWQNCPGVSTALHQFLGAHPKDWMVVRVIPLQLSLRRV